MDHQKWSLRAGTAVIVCALVMRLGMLGFFQPVADFLAQPNIASFLIYLETGRIVRFSSSEEESPVFALESATPDFGKEPAEPPTFSEEDLKDLELKNNSPRNPDLEELITAPLDWDLTTEGPTVLILHTHGTESYTPSPGEDYTESSPFRTLDENYNMVSLGDHLAKILEAEGIEVVHDRELHDYPNYSGSYSHARKSIDAYLKQYPTIRLVLDLHRDASGDNRNQMVTSATVNGEKSAQIMIVVGTNGSGLTHPKWEENLALALKLHIQLERINPGIMRYVNLRSQRFNQDQSPGALIIEIGAAGNTHAEALTATDVLAQGILDLARGSP